MNQPKVYIRCDYFQCKHNIKGKCNADSITISYETYVEIGNNGMIIKKDFKCEDAEGKND